MRNQITLDFREKQTQTLAEKLKKQYKETLDLIVHHEWLVDLLNSELSLAQFESFIAQQAYLYDQLAKHILRLEVKNSEEDHDLLTRTGIFLYSEASENLKDLDGEYYLSCSTRNYSEEIKNIWEKDSYSHKILTILVQLWIREDIFRLLKSKNNYTDHFKIWIKRISNNSSLGLVSSLDFLLSQFFIEVYGDDEEAHFYQEGLRELEHLLSHLIQFELSVRNQAYHINSDQFYKSKQS